MTYQEIRKQKEDSTNKLFTDLLVFWAFSNEQFQQNKTALKKGEKYIDIGAGGFIPKHNLELLLTGMKAIDNTFKEAVKDLKIREKHILYELNNHESFYSGDITNALEALGEDYTKEEVSTIYKKYKAEKYIIK